MPVKDVYHEAVKNALIKDGWVITHDPLRLSFGGREMFVDLGAEAVLAAERREERIAVEVKSFLGKSVLNDLEKALGQLFLYQTVLAQQDAERELYLAIPYDVARFFEEPLGLLLLKSRLVRIISFDPLEEEIVKWIP